MFRLRMSISGNEMCGFGMVSTLLCALLAGIGHTVKITIFALEKSKSRKIEKFTCQEISARKVEKIEKFEKSKSRKIEKFTCQEISARKIEKFEKIEKSKSSKIRKIRKVESFLVF